MTSAAPAAVAATVTASVALAVVKSIQTSAAPLPGSAASMVTPAASIPARDAGVGADRAAPARSVAAVSTRLGRGRLDRAGERSPHPSVGAQDGDADRLGVGHG